MASENKKADWNALSSDENEDQSKKQDEQPVEESKEEQSNEKTQGRTFNNTNKKLVMQHRSEIEQLIDSNRTEDVILNIVKCHFDATVEDVKAAFATFNFTKIENYNPGSFSLEFGTKEEAKAFVEQTRNVKIMGRGFWVKFPVMHQKSTNLEDNTNRDNNPNQAGKKNFDQQPRYTKPTYNRRNFDEDGNAVEGGAQQPQFQRGGGFQNDQQRPERTHNNNNQQYQSHNNNFNAQRHTKKQEEDEWTTVGLNSKPIELKPKKAYNNHQQSSQSYQGQRGGFNRSKQQ